MGLNCGHVSCVGGWVVMCSADGNASLQGAGSLRMREGSEDGRQDKHRLHGKLDLLQRRPPDLILV